MTKEEALTKVLLVKSKRTETQIQDVLNVIENYINSQEVFSYRDTMNFIKKQHSGKMGGEAVFISKALRFLEHELKCANKKSN